MTATAKNRADAVDKQNQQSRLMSSIHAASILDQAHSIRQHHKELEKLSGENFNLLKILKMGHYEVKTHSPILSDLLNPAGSHGQGAVFLKLFITLLQSIGDTDLDSFEPESAVVYMEKHIGERTSKSGGRIDIYIEDKHRRRIFIENKIYAEEQENQLLRYHNHDKSAHLVFLTLQGHTPTSIPKRANANIINASYANHLIQWLENCRKEVVSVPVIRESLTQYIHLLKDLTHQNASNRMSQEITNIVLKSKESLASFRALMGAEREIKKSLWLGLEVELRKLANKLNLSFKADESFIFDRYQGFCFTRELWDRNKFRIRFEFEGKHYNGFAFGLCDSAEMPQPNRQTLQSLACDTMGELHKSDSWPVWGFLNNPYRDWDDETFSEIYFSPSLFIQAIEEKIIPLKEVCDQFCSDHT